MRIEVIEGDITTLAVDTIANAANESLLGGGGVDGAIHRAAGPGLLAECRALPEVWPGVRCPTGEARITGGHRLPARFVIHTVGPVWHGGDSGAEAPGYPPPSSHRTNTAKTMASITVSRSEEHTPEL